MASAPSKKLHLIESSRHLNCQGEMDMFFWHTAIVNL
mgnify:CR=1 FL=1